MIIYLIYAGLILATITGNIKLKSWEKPKVNFWRSYGVPTLIMLIFSWIVSGSNFCGDFNKSYYPAGKLIWSDPAKLYEWGKGLGFVNIPIVAILFTPISFLPKLAAQIFITILGLAAIFLSAYLLIKLTQVKGWKNLAIAGLFLINGPLYYSLKQGNSTHFTLLILICSLFFLHQKREIGVGVLLAIAGMIKIPLLLFGVYYFLRGRWQIFWGFTATILTTVGGSILLFGLDLHRTWVEKCILAFIGKQIAAFNVQSVDGFVARLVTNVDLFSWQLLELGWEFKVTRSLLISLLLGATILVFWRSKPPITPQTQNLEFCIVICLAITISPISWTHYYLYLLLPLSLYIGNQLAIPQGKVWSRLMLLVTVLVSLPVIMIKPNNPIFSFLLSKLLISHYFFGGVLLLGVLLAAKFGQASRREANFIE